MALMPMVWITTTTTLQTRQTRATVSIKGGISKLVQPALPSSPENPMRPQAGSNKHGYFVEAGRNETVERRLKRLLNIDIGEKKRMAIPLQAWLSPGR